MKYHSKQARPELSTNTFEELLEPFASYIYDAGIPYAGWLWRGVNVELGATQEFASTLRSETKRDFQFLGFGPPHGVALKLEGRQWHCGHLYWRLCNSDVVTRCLKNAAPSGDIKSGHTCCWQICKQLGWQGCFDHDAFGSTHGN
jgi:hypothetical protein